MDDSGKVFFSDIELSKRYSIHRATVWRWARDGTFPKPIKLNGATRWKLAEIEAWEAKR